MSRTSALRIAMPAFANQALLWACVPSLISSPANLLRGCPACGDQFWLLGRTCIVPGPGDPPSPVTFSKSPTPSRAVWSARCGTARAIWQYRKYPNYYQKSASTLWTSGPHEPFASHTPRALESNTHQSKRARPVSGSIPGLVHHLML